MIRLCIFLLFLWSCNISNSQTTKTYFDFEIPANFEIQKGEIKKLAEFVYKVNGIEYQTDEIVFQQKGLNDFEQKAFKTYFRIILKPIHERTGIYSVDFKLNELDKVNLEYMDLVKKSLTSNTKFLNSFSPRTEQISGINYPVFSYERKLNDNPAVTVNHFIIQKDNKIISLMISYRTVEKEVWSKSINEFLKSLKIK